jgi:hypothetical protein
MSITFACEDTPYSERRPLPGDADYDPDYPDYVERLPLPPFVEVNLSNDNAFAFQRALRPDVEPDYCGRWERDTLCAVRARLMMLVAVGQGELVAPTVRDGNFITCGRNPDYVRRQLNALLTLVSVALQLERDVVFG